MTAAESFNLWSLTLPCSTEDKSQMSVGFFPVWKEFNSVSLSPSIPSQFSLPAPVSLPQSVSNRVAFFSELRFQSASIRPESVHPCSLLHLVSKLSEGCWVSAIVFFHQTWSFLEFSTPCFASRSPSGRPSVSWLPLRSPDIVTCRPSCFSFPQPRCKYIETGVRPFFARLSVAAKLLKPSSAVTCAWLLPSLHQSRWMFEFTARLLATRVTRK